MKLSDLKPCERCHKPLGALNFARVTTEFHLINPVAAQQALGMEQFFGGNGRIASVFDAYGEEATSVIETHSEIVCMSCATGLARATQGAEGSDG